MSEKKIYLAVDLGSGSGRVMAGEYDGERIELHELNRFDNTPVELPDGWHWNITALFQNILDGIMIAADTYGDQVRSIGIDTWGVDYGLLDKEGRLLGLPYQYRDDRTKGMMKAAFSEVPKEEIYEGTGIQFMAFNTVFQLLSERLADTSALAAAEDLLFLPDLLSYWLTGEKTQERSIASTSQLYDPRSKDWNFNLIEKLGLPKRIFKSIVDPGTPLGLLTERLQTKTGLYKTKVISVGGHDTASAVAAVPSQSKTPAYLSSGTWSLMGLEVDEPIVNQQSFRDAFTNEIGVGGKVRFLKNICGLWLIQECRRYWQEHGNDIPYGRMAPLAEEAEAFRSFIDPDHSLFATAGDMPQKIREFCDEFDQPIPATHGQIIRCIYESLALRYAQTWKKLMAYLENKPKTLHIIGGGCQDRLLNQFAANATGMRVAACPVEATALGNILTQLLSEGSIFSISEGRQIVLKSSLVETFDPVDAADWGEARRRFDGLFPS